MMKLQRAIDPPFE